MSNSEKKKISLQDAIKQKLASKSHNQSNGRKSNQLLNTTPVMKSQQTKKINNQRKRMGV